MTGSLAFQLEISVCKLGSVYYIAAFNFVAERKTNIHETEFITIKHLFRR